MPFLPEGWTSNTPVSPTNLNTSLYSFFEANPGWPTGVQFHGRKPVYKAVANAAYSIGSGAWGFPFQGQGAANVIEDAAMDYGAPMDAPQWGAIQSNLPGADGNFLNPLPGGGWFLLWAFLPIGPAGSNGVTFEADLSTAGTNTTYGQNVLAASGISPCPWTVDLVSMQSVVWTPYVFNGDAVAKNTQFNAEGTGTSTCFHALWAAVVDGVIPEFYPPAPKTTWAAGDQWTSNWANGAAGLTNVLEFLNQPPVLRADSGPTVATSLANKTATVISLPNVTVDTWSAYSNSAYTWTCPADGIYFIYGLVTYNTATMAMQTSIRVNGTDYWGPGNICLGVQDGTSAKAQVFSLLAGDTVQLVGYQASGGTIATHVTQKPRLIIVWLSGQGVPGVINANPYFTQGSLTGWNAFGATLAAAQQGTVGGPYPWCALLTPNNTQTTPSAEESGAAFTVTPGAWYGISAWVNAAGTTSTLIGFDWTNSGTYVSTSALTAAPSTGTWALLHTIQQAPGSGVTSGYCRIGRSSAGNVGTASAMYIAGVQAAQSGTAQSAPPDLTYRYAAGTPAGSVTSVFNTYLGNDLSFLTWRPYLLSYQTSSQSVANAASVQASMNIIQGTVHSDYGDNFGGWNTANSRYVAQASGWYLAVFEVSVAVNAASSFPAVQARLQVSTTVANWDAYEYRVVTSSATDGTIPGGTAIGLYYLRAGDYIFPGVIVENYASSTSTVVTAGHRSHFEVVWVSE